MVIFSIWTAPKIREASPLAAWIIYFLTDMNAKFFFSGFLADSCDQLWLFM